MSTTTVTTTTQSLLPPNQTLYITNLNDKIRKADLRASLYTLFGTYGVVLDVVALKTMRGRGQAHVAFRDVASATGAMRALQGFEMLGKAMRISYARGKSHAVAKLDGTYRLPTSAQQQGLKDQLQQTFVPVPDVGEKVLLPQGVVAGQKRQREDDDEVESDGEEAEMEMEDD